MMTKTLLVVLVAFVLHLASAQYTVDRLYAVCYPYSTSTPQLFLFNPTAGSYKAGPAFDADTAKAASGADSVGLHHGLDNNLYLSLYNSTNFGGNLFVRKFNTFVNRFPNTVYHEDTYFTQVSGGGLSQPCGPKSGGNPPHYTFSTDNELYALDVDHNTQTRTGLKTGGWATNLAYNKVTQKFNRLVLNAGWPFDNPLNDVVSTGLYLQEFDPVALTTSVKSVQAGAEWDPSDMYDNLEVSSDGKLLYMLANWVDSNEWNSGIEALIQNNLLQSTALPTSYKRNAPLADNENGEDFLVEDLPPVEADDLADVEDETRQPFETRSVAESAHEQNVRNSLGSGVTVHKLNLHIPGMAAPGTFYNPAFARAEAHQKSHGQGFKASHVVDNLHSGAVKTGRQAQIPKALQGLTERCTIAPYLVTLDAKTLKTIAVLDMGELYCEALAHYRNPCNGLYLGDSR